MEWTRHLALTDAGDRQEIDTSAMNHRQPYTTSVWEDERCEIVSLWNAYIICEKHCTCIVVQIADILCDIYSIRFHKQLSIIGDCNLYYCDLDSVTR